MDRFAEELGKTILIGVTRLEADGSEEHEQYAGRIARFTGEPQALAVISCLNGEERTYPWDPDALTKAPPGDYRLRSDGTIISDPDWLMQWTVHQEH